MSITIPENIKIHHYIHDEKKPPTPKDPTLEKTREVVGKILFTTGLVLTAATVLGLAGHVVGIVSTSVVSLAILLVIAHNITVWGHNLITNQATNIPSMNLAVKTEIDLVKVAGMLG